MLHTIKLIWSIASDPCLFLGGVLSAECSQWRPMGSGTDGPNVGLFCLIVDVCFFLFFSFCFEIEEDLWHIWSGEKSASWALQERTLLVSLFKCLKWIFRSTFPYALDTPTLSQNYASRGIFRYHLPLTLWWKHGPLKVRCIRAVPLCSMSISKGPSMIWLWLNLFLMYT